MSIRPSSGGEVVALDAAGYGTVTVGKSTTIPAIGIEGSITSNSTTPNGIVSNAGASGIVKLRGLTLFSGTNSGDGIRISSAKSVTIQGCTISGFPADGISVIPSSSTSVNAGIRGVSVDHNGGNGLNVAPTGSGAVTLYVNDSHFGGNTHNGVSVDAQNSAGPITGTLSVGVETNGANGIQVASVFNGPSQPVIMVTNTQSANNTNGFGLISSGNVRVFVDRAQISGNAVGWNAVSGASVSSYKNNEVNGNTSNGIANDGLNGVVQITSE